MKWRIYLWFHEEEIFTVLNVEIPYEVAQPIPLFDLSLG